MKKLSSMLALGMALALTFGMTVSAAESPATQNPEYKPTETEIKTAEDTIKELPTVTQDDVKATVTDSTGNKVEITVEVKPIQAATVAEFQSTNVAEKAVESLKSNGGEAKVTDTIAKAMAAANLTDKVDSSTQKVTDVKIEKKPVAAAVVEIPENVDISKGVQLEISLPGFTPKAGTTYVVMHLGKDGWEIIAPDAIADGKVTATFTSLSPVTVNEVTFTVVPVTPPTEVGEDVDNDEDDSDDNSNQGQAATPTAANPGTSPKTAETLPVAGVMALIALAGAAVCAGRIRYNK